MAEKNTDSGQNGSSQSGNNSSGQGEGLPKPDPDLSDYYKRDGNSQTIVRK